MEIELRNIHIFDQASEESLAFFASLYIDGRNVGAAFNNGMGGNTLYHPDHPDDMQLLKEVDDYCRTFPSWQLDDKLSVPMNLRVFIEMKVAEYANKEELKRFQREMELSMFDHIVFGVPGASEFRSYPTIAPVAEMLSLETGQQSLSNEIKHVVVQFLKPGEQILNTNIPSDLLDLSNYKKEGQQQERKIHPDSRRGNPPKLT
ncbi:hypothetical protein [Chitinophaga defluvii]|uniref:Uncharacterized protein n=1 Tax=Chitinophaga defluvii TaxID=3163343 RepID=A0ABV2T8N3_9BACT